MDKYRAKDVTEACNLKKLTGNKEAVQCWILYRTCEKTGITICVTNSLNNRVFLEHAIPDSIHYILYNPTEGEYIRGGWPLGAGENEIIMEEVLEVCELLNIVDESDKSLGYVAETSWEDYKDIIYSDNGFCVFDYGHRDCFLYNPFQTPRTMVVITAYFIPCKKVGERDMYMMSCAFPQKGFDYEEYMSYILDGEEKLSEKERIRFFGILEDNFVNYNIFGLDAVFSCFYDDDPEESKTHHYIQNMQYCWNIPEEKKKIETVFSLWANTKNISALFENKKIPMLDLGTVECI